MDLPAAGPATEAAALPAWPRTGRFAFRFASTYLVLSVLTVSGVVTLLPFAGNKLGHWIELFWLLPAQWLGHHVFHLAGVAAHPHASDSRDEALDWITLGLLLVTALGVAILWSVLDRKRLQYRTAAAWLRFGLRLTLVFLMFRYGLMKLFPLQMSPPSLAVLNEPVGATSPMTLLWTLIGLHPGYEIVCGAIETGAAILLFFRRTALLGALLTAFVMTNVLLFNLFFDVPVKLGAANLLVLALALIAPDLGGLYTIFWHHRPAPLDGFWEPPVKRSGSRLAFRAFEIVFVVLVLARFLPVFAHAAAQERASTRHPSPLTGEWRVDSSLFVANGQTSLLPVLTGEGEPMTALYFEPNGRVMARSSDGKLWRAQAVLDLAHQSLALDSGYFDGDRFAARYTFTQPDASHLVLTPMGKSIQTNGTLTLTRIPLPAHYPLLERGFHWVNEWALER